MNSLDDISQAVETLQQIGRSIQDLMQTGAVNVPGTVDVEPGVQGQYLSLLSSITENLVPNA